jgi:phospholipase/carboxylesterase
LRGAGGRFGARIGDPRVPAFRKSVGMSSAQGHAVEWHEYPMQHEVCAEELAEIGRWLSARLAGHAR